MGNHECIIFLWLYYLIFVCSNTLQNKHCLKALSITFNSFSFWKTMSSSLLSIILRTLCEQFFFYRDSFFNGQTIHNKICGLFRVFKKKKGRKKKMFLNGSKNPFGLIALRWRQKFQQWIQIHGKQNYLHCQATLDMSEKVLFFYYFG